MGLSTYECQLHDYRGFAETGFEKPRLLSKPNSGDLHAPATESKKKKKEFAKIWFQATENTIL